MKKLDRELELAYIEAAKLASHSYFARLRDLKDFGALQEYIEKQKEIVDEIKKLLDK